MQNLWAEGRFRNKWWIMENIDNDDINREIERIKRSIDNMDMQSINESIGETVNKALGHAARNVEQAADRIGQTADRWRESQNAKSQQSAFQSTGSPYRYGTESGQGYRISKTRRTSICVPPKGRILGRIAMIFGGFWTILFASCMFMMATLGGASESLLLLPFAAIGLSAVIWGVGKVRRYSRYQSYVREMGGKPFVKTERLANATGKSLKYTLRDIRNMIRDGVFPSGRLSDEEDYLMLTSAVYEDYVRARDDMKRRQREEQENQDKTEREKLAQEEEKAADEKTKLLRETIRTGREYLRQIEEANDEIEAKEISEKLFRLQVVIDKIFYCVEQNPEKLSEIKQFMEYYLPTTLKLVNAYRNFCTQPVQGENITSAKAEIEKAIDTINSGFENLLDDLFRQDALDISTDIYVLENMLAREGLTENEFEKMRSGGEG